VIATGNRLQRALDDLMQGVDQRGPAAYGLPLLDSASLLHFGSCTANPITASTLARHEKLAAAPNTLDPRQALQLIFGAAQCVLAHSGTDAEYTCALAMGPEPFHTVLMDPSELGSGCLRAAVGQVHVVGGPVVQPLAVQATAAWVPLRDAAGRPLRQAVVDQQVIDLVAELPATPLLLHHVPCSKTGLSAPSEAACLEIQRRQDRPVRVVVDASQGRFRHADVRRWLGYGWAVMITGSKFFGAPPFCGATLLPPGWPAAKGFEAGPGLRARWRLALEDLATEPCRATWSTVLETVFVPRLRQAGLDVEHDDDGAPDRQGILAFDPGLDAGRTRLLHRALIARGYFLGQPVTAGQRHLLRVALGARTPLADVAAPLERLARVLRQELAHG
jgi:hypothetical protein